MTTAANPDRLTRLARLLHNFQEALTAQGAPLPQEEAITILGEVLGHPGWAGAIRDAIQPPDPAPKRPGPGWGNAEIMDLSEAQFQGFALSLLEGMQMLAPQWTIADAQEVMGRAMGHSGWDAALLRANRQPPDATAARLAKARPSP